MDPFIAEIVMFGGNFAPRGWAFCSGQLLAISQYSALFSILGTTYGGDGRTTFALPDLRGRVPMNHGTGPGLSTRKLGQRGGVERVTLTVNQMPSHSHSTIDNSTTDQHVLLSRDAAVNVTPEPGDVPAKAAVKPALGTGDDVMSFGPPTNLVQGQTLSGNAGLTILNNGGSQYHTNVQPFLAVSYIIAMQGVYPSRS
ncbi:phage tail protein [Wenyingzhuangia sp. IMCC45533]